MQDVSKLPPGTIVPMSNEEFKDYQSQLALKATQAMTVPSKPSAEEFARDFETYRQIQKTIDKCMPDSIMDIQGKPFRKKSYWRAVATAFNLHVEPSLDEYFEVGEDWGYKVTYVATTPSGRPSSGDGTCMHSDKLVYDWDYTKKPRVRLGVNKAKTEDNATHHNVRGHAHTRAFNRAVSNLVGFGEVSAEEMPTDRLSAPPGRGAAPPSRGPQASSGPWDGQLPVTFGKYKPGAKEGGPNGKKWSELSTSYLDWILGPKCTIDTAKDMAGKEVGRRAKAEAKSDVVDAEEIPLPLDTPDGVHDPRLFESEYEDDDGYSP